MPISYKKSGIQKDSAFLFIFYKLGIGY